LPREKKRGKIDLQTFVCSPLTIRREVKMRAVRVKIWRKR